MRHRHADLIHAWAEGAEIEQHCAGRGWVLVCTPVFSGNREYRIKPAKKPDVVRYYNKMWIKHTAKEVGRGEGEQWPEDDILRLTFSGETGELIKAEVLK